MQRLTQDYLQNVMDTYRRYFFTDVDLLEEEEFKIKSKEEDILAKQNEEVDEFADLDESDLEVFQELEQNLEEMDALCAQLEEDEIQSQVETTNAKNQILTQNFSQKSTALNFKKTSQSSKIVIETTQITENHQRVEN
jgi:hypothetical protein